MSDAILLVGHGTRNETGQRQFVRLAELLREVVTVPVEVAYIELQSPSIEEALVRMYGQGLKDIALSPALLFAAGHAKRDLPAAVTAAKSRCLDLQVTIAEPLGCHEAILELAALRASSSLAPVLRGEGRGEGPAAPIDNATTSLVVIGRGSSDPDAIAHCREFARRLASQLNIKTVHTGFIAIAQPSLREVLDLAGAAGSQLVIVLPHLIFSGEMLEATSAAVQSAQQSFPQLTWRQAEILGSDLLDEDSPAAAHLVRALRDRLR